MVNVVDFLEAQLVADPAELGTARRNRERALGVPESIRQMIEKQVEHLSERAENTGNGERGGLGRHSWSRLECWKIVRL